MRCRRCLNDETVRGITLDSSGVCNFCRNYDEIREKLEDETTLHQLFQERIDAVRGKHRYDAALGISGGKDSEFVLHELVRKHGLHVCTFTLDNGFLSQEAKNNIDKTVRNYGVDHEYITFDRAMQQRQYHYSMKHFLVPCIACSYTGYAAMINYAVKVDAGMCVHGRSPEQMLRRYGNDVFTRFVDMGLKSIHEIDIAESYAGLLESVREKVDEGIYNDIRSIAFDGVDGIEFREFVPYFLYYRYDEKEIVRFLKEETGWTPPDDYNHYDCSVHNATKYIYQCAEGRPHRLPEISVLIRMGMMTREEALEMLEQEELVEKPKEELKELCRYSKVSPIALLAKAELYKRKRK